MSLRSLEEQYSVFCNTCFNGFKNPEEFEDHILREHKQQPIMCCFRCHLIFHDYKVCMIHMAERHDVEHLCLYCPEAYNGLMYRKNVAKTYYQCIYCNKVYRTSKNLYNHLHIHDKPFTCPCCVYKYNTKHSLRRHLIKKHFEKPCSWLPSLPNPKMKF